MGISAKIEGLKNSDSAALRFVGGLLEKDTKHDINKKEYDEHKGPYSESYYAHVYHHWSNIGP